MNKKLFVVFLLFAISILNIIDVVWTDYAVKSGIAVEANPIANYLLQNNLHFLVKSALSILCIAFAIYIYFKPFEYVKASIIILMPIFVFYLGAVFCH
jgi:hypothetical protein